MALHRSLLISAPLTVTGPDAPLIATCNDFVKMQIDLQTWATGPAGEVRQPALEAAFKRMLTYRATTQEGFRARALALAIYQDDEAGEAGEWPSALLEVLLRDMLGLPDEDAQLVALCDEFEDTQRAVRAIFDEPGRTLDDEEATETAQPLEEHTVELLDRLGKLRARTSTGIHARARALASHNGDAVFGVDDRGSVSGRLYEYLCRDARAVGLGETAT